MTVTFPSRISRKLTVIQFMSCLFWKETKPTRELTNNWFDAQDKCLGHGLTIDIDKSNQPYWTGVYRRLTPWINILGQYLFVFFYHQYTLLFNIIFNSPIILFCCFFSVLFTNIHLYTLKCFWILSALFEGCYSISIESLPDIVEMTMTKSSVGMCQEICHHENIDQFAVKVGVGFTHLMQLKSVFCLIRFDL